MITNQPVETTRKLVTEIKSNKERLEEVVDLREFGKDIFGFFETKDELRKINTVEGFIEKTETMIEESTSFTVAQKKASKELVTEIIKITAFSLMGFSGVGIYSIVSMYNSSMAIMYQDMYDKAALLGLASSRSTRLGLRGYYGGW